MMLNLIEQDLRDVVNAPIDISGDYATDDYSHIITIPDVHGDHRNYILALWGAYQAICKRLGSTPTISYQQFQNNLLNAARVGIYPDEPLHVGSRVVAVSLGDLVDRGPDSLLCLRILWVINRVLGWKVVSLYGNHELMASRGNLDYIHPNELYDYNGSTELRQSLVGLHSVVWKYFVSTSVLVARFNAPDGKRVLFSHAGVSSDWLRIAEENGMGVSHSEWNQSVYTNFISGNEEEFMHMHRILVKNEASPVWTRVYGYLNFDPSVVCYQDLVQAQVRLETDYMVLGHTPMERANSICGGKIWRTDVALSRDIHPNGTGNPSVLVFEVDSTLKDRFADIFTCTGYHVRNSSYAQMKATKVGHAPLPAQRAV